MSSKLWTLDTEDDSKGNPIIINFYDGHEHFTFPSTQKALDWLINQTGPIEIWAVNCEYDLNNLFGKADELLCERTYLKSSFVKARLVGIPKLRVEFRDTLRHWKIGVAEMGLRLGFPKLDADFKHMKYDEKNITYCRRDTEITHRWVTAQKLEYAKIGADLKATIGSSAMSLWKNAYGGDAGKLSLRHRERCAKALRGGRVEIFKTGLVHGKIDCYDINSMYPYVMSHFPYPEIGSQHEPRIPDFNSEGVAWVRIDYPANIKIPCLPVRRSSLMFPVGKIEGAFCYPEIRQALADGAKVTRFSWAVEFRRTCRPFDDYVNDLYNKRKVSKDPLERDSLKGFMNNLFGKFGAKGEIEIIRGIERKVRNPPSPDANKIWAAYVTSYARLHLLKALRAHQDEILYCDTDSMYLLDAENVKTGNELGEWKHEGTWGTAHFRLPKVYMLEERGERQFKCKGVKKKNAEQFFDGLEVEYDSPIRFRESFSRGIKPNVWIKKTRQIHHQYDKRVLFPDGSTAPLVLA